MNSKNPEAFNEVVSGILETATNQVIMVEYDRYNNGLSDERRFDEITSIRKNALEAIESAVDLYIL